MCYYLIMESPQGLVAESAIEISNVPEHKLRVFEQTYHGSPIKTVELEHGRNLKYGPKSIRPKDWQQLLKNQIDSSPESLIFPEYSMPDLEKYAFNKLGTGEFARGTAEELGITDFYSLISKLAGIRGRPLFATDITNTNWYPLYEIYLKRKANEKFTWDANKIDELERKTQNPNDARHLITARGLMQESLRQNLPAIHITAPSHAIRIDDYVKRQNDWESKSGIKVEQPADFTYVSPIEEQTKMRKYGKFPFQRTIREYSPTLPPISYEIDLLANEPTQELNFPLLHGKIGQYLDIQPVNSNQREIFARIKRYSDELKKLENSSDKKKYERAAKSIMTDRFGWLLRRKTHIY